MTKRAAKGLGLGLCALAIIPMTGCGTLIYPGRSLVPESQRGGLDPFVLAGDIVVGSPFIVAGALVFVIFLIVGAPKTGEDFGDCIMKLFLFPAWVDDHHGTLYYPKPGWKFPTRR